MWRDEDLDVRVEDVDQWRPLSEFFKVWKAGNSWLQSERNHQSVRLQQCWHQSMVEKFKHARSRRWWGKLQQLLRLVLLHLRRFEQRCDPQHASTQKSFKFCMMLEKRKQPNVKQCKATHRTSSSFMLLCSLLVPTQSWLHPQSMKGLHNSRRKFERTKVWVD